LDGKAREMLHQSEDAVDGAAERPDGALSTQAPGLEVELLRPTLQQQEGMAEGLRILAAWLLRRHKRALEESEKVSGGALTSAPDGALLSGDGQAAARLKP